jgi:hypothetical protein
MSKKKAKTKKTTTTVRIYSDAGRPADDGLISEFLCRLENPVNNFAKCAKCRSPIGDASGLAAMVLTTVPLGRVMARICVPFCQRCGTADRSELMLCAPSNLRPENVAVVQPRSIN